MNRGGPTVTRGSFWISAVVIGSPAAIAAPMNEPSRGRTSPWWSFASTPVAIITRRSELFSTVSATAPRSASRMLLACRTMPRSTSISSAPDSSAATISAFASIQRCRSRDCLYSRAFSMATPAATASVRSTVSSSLSNSPPPRFWVR